MKGLTLILIIFISYMLLIFPGVFPWIKLKVQMALALLAIWILDCLGLFDDDGNVRDATNENY